MGRGRGKQQKGLELKGDRWERREVESRSKNTREKRMG